MILTSKCLKPLAGFVLFLFVIQSIPADAIPIPVLDIAQLTERSDIIVVGLIEQITVGEVTDIGPMRNIHAKGRYATVLLRVGSVLKGNVRSASVSFRLFKSELPDGYGFVSESTYRMLFLRDNGSGQLTVVSPYYPSLPAVSGVAPQGDTPLDRVQAMLGAVLASEGVSFQVRRDAIVALGTAKTKSGALILERALNDADRRIRLSAAVALLQQNDINALPTATKTLLDASATVDELTVHNLASAIYLGIQDARAIPALSELAQSKYVEARRAAVFAMRNTQSPSALPFLTRALNDSDFDTRYYAAIGLAEINNEPGWRPSEDEFRADESRFVQHWLHPRS